MSCNRGFVQFGVYPHDLQNWCDVLQEAAGDAGTEAAVGESLGLDQDVVMSHSSSLLENLDADCHDLFMPGGVSVEEREESGRVDEGHA
jgi:hypothetical protein